MATIDKQSVRDEFDKIKVSFDEQVKAGKVSTEVAMLVNTLMMLFNLVLTIFMEKTTKKTSKNSSIPPSQTTPDDTSSTNKNKTNRDKGEQKKVTMAGNTRTVETVTIIPALACELCGEDLSKIACICTERRTMIDIIFEKTEEHVEVEIKQCPCCGNTAKPPFPKDMPGPVQYGNGIKAYVIQLIVMQMMSLNRVADMVSALIGRLIAESTMLSFIMRLHSALAVWENEAKAALLKTSYTHVDETSLRVDKKNHWIHVYASDDITLKFLHEKRGKAAIEAIDIIPRYGGVIIHDCWASYLSYGHLDHGLCGSHLLRELTFIVDSNGYIWAKKLKRLLQRVCNMVSRREEKCLTEVEYLKLEQLYKKILAAGEKELPPIPEKTTKRRGESCQIRCAQLMGASNKI